MIDVNEAKRTVEKLYNEYPISNNVIDIGGSYIFSFNTGYPQIPGVPTLEFDKESGEVRIFSLPDLENFSKLKKGQIIKL